MFAVAFSNLVDAKRHYEYEPSPCYECYGTGLCQECDGSGWQTEIEYDEDDEPFETEVVCRECNGSGNCQLCFGSGEF